MTSSSIDRRADCTLCLSDQESELLLLLLLLLKTLLALLLREGLQDRLLPLICRATGAPPHGCKYVINQVLVATLVDRARHQSLLQASRCQRAHERGQVLGLLKVRKRGYQGVTLTLYRGRSCSWLRRRGEGNIL